MHTRHKYGGLVLLILAVVVAVFFALKRQPPATASAIQITFVGHTNLPGNDRRFALFTVSNQAAYPVRWRGDWIEIEGRQHHMGRIVNASLPGFTYKPVLKARLSLELAVGEPFDASETGRWKLSMAFSRYSVAERWFDVSMRHKLPLNIGPLVLVDSQRILNPSNHVTVSSAWLAK